MNLSTIAAGPLAISTSVLLVLASGAIGTAFGSYIGRRTGQQGVADHAMRVFIVAIVVSRLAFIWQYRQAYLDSPLDILDVRDGGWAPQEGVIAAWMYVMILIRRHAGLKRSLLAAALLASCLWIAGTLVMVLEGDDETSLPAMDLPSFGGTSASLSAFKGKPTVVNLWATWCPPCQREMPTLAHAQRVHPEFHFVFVNQGESSRQVEQFLSAHHLKLNNVLLDQKGLAGATFDQAALPTTLFFDAAGRLVDRRIGELSKAALKQKLMALQEKSDAGSR